MTDHTPTRDPDQAAVDTRQARIAAVAQSRKPSGGTTKRRRHPAQGARIAAAGLGAATMLGLVGAMAYNQAPTGAPAPTTPAAARASAPPQVVVVVHRTGAPDTVATPVAPAGTRTATPLTARPTVRPASPRTQAPAASTSGSH